MHNLVRVYKRLTKGFMGKILSYGKVGRHMVFLSQTRLASPNVTKNMTRYIQIMYNILLFDNKTLN